MTADPAPPIPASPSGIDRLASIVAEVLGSRSVRVDGSGRDDLAPAFDRAGMAVDLSEQALSRAEVVVSLGVLGGTSVHDARSHVGLLVENATLAVVFSAADDVRFLPWWDELFAERDCQPVDILRPRLWDDDCWDAGALSSLTLYVRRSARSAVRGDLDAEAIPRSAIHPGLFVPARRDVEAMRTLAMRLNRGASPDVDAVAVVERVLDERSAALEAAREERRTSSTGLAVPSNV